MTQLLRNERPLILLPELAVKIGLNEAIVLQQIHYWMVKKRHIIEGRSWIYNTYEDWQKQFPFWSVTTIRRTLKRMEKQGLLLTGTFNVMAFDRTKWYTINLEKLDLLIGSGEPMDETMESKHTDDTTKPAASLKEKHTQQNIGSEREAFEQSLGKEKVTEAIELARSKGITTWAYIRAILRNREKDSRKLKKRAQKERIPDWLKKDMTVIDNDDHFEHDRASFLAELRRVKLQVKKVPSPSLKN